MGMFIAILFTVLSVVFLFIAISHSVEDGEPGSRGVFIGLILAFNTMAAIAYWHETYDMIHAPVKAEMERLSRDKLEVELNINDITVRELLDMETARLKQGNCLERIDSTDLTGGRRFTFRRER